MMFAHDENLENLYDVIEDEFDYCVKKQDFWETDEQDRLRQIGEFDILGYDSMSDTIFYIEVKDEDASAEEQLEKLRDYCEDLCSHYVGMPFYYSKTDRKANENSMWRLRNMIKFNVEVLRDDS